MINATLFVQAFNFFIAYLLLRTLLFKPAMKSIDQEQQERDHLDQQIADRQTSLEQKAQQKEKDWEEKQAAFKEAAPDIRPSHVAYTEVEPEQKPVKPDEQELEALVDEVQEAVEKKVRHD